MVFPLYDDNSDRQITPLINYAIIALNIFVFVVLQGIGSNDQFTYSFSTVPAEILQGHDIVTPARVVEYMGQRVTIPGLGPTPGSVYFTLFTSMFMHGGWTHIGGNMLFLFIFGDNVEKAFGHIRYLAFYLVCGFVASLAQVYSAPDSILPSLGASGAIAGVLAGYLVLFPTNRVRVLLGYFITTVPAIAMIGLWALIQFFNGFASTSVSAQTGGVAYMAHIGGFIAGLVLAFVLKPFSDRGVGPHVVGYPRRGTFS
jgi:membrane associated rhomboid family serine protease